MKATVSEPETWKRVIDIEVPEEDLRSAFDEKVTKFKREMKLPGFRPGKVPENLIRQRYGSAIRAEVIDELIQKSYKEACEEKSIVPVAPAKVNDLKAPEGQPLSISVETQVDPSIEIKGYNKLKIKVSPSKIKDSDIEDAVNNLKERFATFQDVDRPAKKGDFLQLEYLKVVVDGEERKDIKNPEHPVELGGESRIKDFDKGLMGHLSGDVVDITVDFPKDYPDSDVAGKGGEFQLKINAVQEKVVPQLDEEFLKKLGDIKDEGALREQIRKNLEQEEQNKSKDEAYNKAIDKLIEDNSFEVPPARVEQFLDYMQQEAERYQRPGTPLLSREELESRYRDTAIRAIKRQRIIEYVASKENIKATQDEVDKEIQRLAVAYNQPFETLKQAFRQNGTTLKIRDDLREQKTLDYLIGEYTPEAAGK